MDYVYTGARWWFQIFCIFTPTWRNDPKLTNIFSNGLKPSSFFSNVFLLPSLFAYKTICKSFFPRHKILFSEWFFPGFFLEISKRKCPACFCSKSVSFAEVPLKTAS